MNKEEIINEVMGSFKMTVDTKGLNKLEKYIDNLEQENQQLKEELKKLKQPVIFIDTQDMEERYGEGLYMDYLKEENQLLKDRINKASDEILKDKMEQFDDYIIYLLEKYENILKEDSKEGNNDK